MNAGREDDIAGSSNPICAAWMRKARAPMTFSARATLPATANIQVVLDENNGDCSPERRARFLRSTPLLVQRIRRSLGSFRRD
jgi:hypothetical protein